MTGSILKKDLPFIGKEITDWTQFIRRGYALSFLLYSFHDTGVFKYLKDGKKRSIKEIAKKLKLDEKILSGGMNFFANADNSIVKDKSGKFKISKIGKKRIFANQTLAMSLGAVGAYNIILTQYAAAMQKKKIYGKDFVRDGRLVATSSVLTGQANYPWVIEKLKKLKVKTVIDLGCGSGDIIIHFCKRHKELRGVGLDINRGAILEAKRNVKKAKLNNRIDLIQGDMINPRTYSKKIKHKGKQVAFNAIMALHEFLRDGEVAVINILKKMKKEFPGSYFILGEFNKASDSEFAKIPLSKRMHMLFYQEIIHNLTNQALANKKTWKKIFKKANVKLLEVKENFPFRLVEYVIQF
jgi:ubiquinone/menaquinone biosynthesis C-methylase UbiE